MKLKSYLVMSALALGTVTLLAQPSLADHHSEGDHPYKKHGKWGGEDGKMSKDEFMERQAAKFDKMDKDGDGYVSKDEKKAMRKHMKEKYKHRKEKMMEGKENSGNDDSDM